MRGFVRGGPVPSPPMEPGRSDRAHHWMRGRARFTPVVVAIYLTGSCTVLGFVGLAASQPHPASVTFVFPNGNGTGIARFYPQPGWGSYAVHVWFPGISDPRWCGFGCLPRWSVTVTVSVYACADVNCSTLNELIDYSESASSSSRQTVASQFLIVASSNARPLTMVVSTDYFASGDGWLPTGGSSNFLLVAPWMALGGLGSFFAALMMWRHESRPLPSLPRVGPHP